MNDDFHKPFIKSLMVVAFVTVFAMVSSKLLVNYYMNFSLHPPKSVEYSSHKSQD